MKFRIGDLSKSMGSGGTPSRKKKEFYENGTIRWLKTKELDDKNIYDTEEYITEEALKYSSAKLYPKNTITMAMYGATVAKLGVLKNETSTNQACCNIVVDDNKVDYRFLFYSLLFNRKRLISLANGAAQQNLNKGIIENFEIECFELNEQKIIAAILSSLDDKIENNRKTCEKLEEIAQAIFKRWFVDFEFPCLPENYKFTGTRKPSLPGGAGKPYSREELVKVCTYKRVGGLPAPENGKYFVYVLLCEDGSFYKGITSDLYGSFYEHYSGQGAEWTGTHKPVKVIHYEEFNSRNEAAAREKELKTSSGREWLEGEYGKLLNGLHLSNSELMQAGEMEYCEELGKGVPKGWKQGVLEDIGTIVGGSTPSTKRDDYYNKGNIPWITPRDLSKYDGVFISNGENFITEEGYNSCSTKLLEKGSILFTSRAPIGYIAIASEEVCTNQGFKSIMPNKGFGTEFVYELMKLLTPQIISKGSGSTFKEISGTSMKKISVLIPLSRVVKKYCGKFRYILDLTYKQEREALILQQTRDTLLPKLMNGELRMEN